MYVLPMEKHELDLVTSTCTMSYNVLMRDCTRHTNIINNFMITTKSDIISSDNLFKKSLYISACTAACRTTRNKGQYGEIICKEWHASINQVALIHNIVVDHS
jgi:hypothetical protein